jgi:hypothetical protein
MLCLAVLPTHLRTVAWLKGVRKLPAGELRKSEGPGYSCLKFGIYSGRIRVLCFPAFSPWRFHLFNSQSAYYAWRDMTASGSFAHWKADNWSGTKRFGDHLSDKRPPETGSLGLLQHQSMEALGTKSYTGYVGYKPSRWGGSGTLSPRESGVPNPSGPSVSAIAPSPTALPTSCPSQHSQRREISPRTAAGPLPPLDFPLPNKQELKGCSHQPGVDCIQQVSSPRSAPSRGKPHFPSSSAAYSTHAPIFPQPVLLQNSPTSCRTWVGSDVNHLHSAPAFTSGLAMMRHARNA